MNASQMSKTQNSMRVKDMHHVQGLDAGLGMTLTWGVIDVTLGSKFQHSSLSSLLHEN